jgi:hypothetical protein
MLLQLNSPRLGPLTSDEWVGRGFLLIAYVTSVLSNAIVLKYVIPVEVKHGEFIFIAVISLLRHPVRALRAAAVALPIALIYIYGDLWSYFVMVLVLALSLPMLWEGVLSVVSRRDYRFLFVLALIAMIPAVLSLPYLLDQGIFDTTYGRPRILLGYFHPKEAAIAFAVPVLLAMLMTRTSKAVYWFVGCAFLWLVGSRNIALLIFLAWALRWHGRWVMVLLLTSIPMLAMWLFLSDDWYDTVDNLMSLRLSVWSDVLNTTYILKGLDVDSGDRFGADNFFVEALVISGPVALPLIILWGAGVMLALRLRGQSSPWPFVCLAMLIFIATFDSGIASTGNFMHVLLWTIMLSPLFYQRKTQQSLSKPIKSTGRITLASVST